MPNMIDPEAYLATPRAAKNIRFAAWAFTLTFNVIWVANFASAAGDPRFDGRPTVRIGFLVASLVLGAATVWLSARLVRISVCVEKDTVNIRNLFRSHTLPIAEIDHFEYGFPESKWPGGANSGAVVLVDSTRLPVMGISGGVTGATDPPESSRILLETLNNLVAGSTA